jgi:hydroxymethylbilane synthase
MVDCQRVGDLSVSAVNPGFTIATRESRLAMWQAHHVRDRLETLHPGLAVGILGMTTVGDQRLDRPLSEIGGKGLFTKELEVALLEKRAQLAVHSLKDVPMQLGPEFSLAAVMRREDPRDALVSARFTSLAALPPNAKVGTSSLRRAAQLKALYPQMQILPLRGNLDTRLSKLDNGEYDAIILAAAGLKRLGLAARIAQMIPTDLLVPSPGQGALGIETLAKDSNTINALTALIDLPTLFAVSAERAVSLALGGNCKLPLAAFCEPTSGASNSGKASFDLIALVASNDGKRMLKVHYRAPVHSVSEAVRLGTVAARDLLDQGALAVLGQ